MRGLEIRENEMGLTAVRLHYSADPSRDQVWYDRVRKLFPDPNQWESEMEISFWVAQGTRVYPEFREQTHVRQVGLRERKVIYRAWDFGWHAPACLVAQIDAQDRLIILHEVIGREETTRQFAQKVIERCNRWYPFHNAGYTDFCDPAGQHITATANEKDEKRDVEVLNALGIYPTWEHGWSRKDGRSLVHQLLATRSDDTPSLFVATGECPVLLQGFLGKYVYAPKKGGQVHDEPDENLHPWADAQAALRYLATGLYSALGLRRQKAAVQEVQELTYHGYGTPTR